MTEYTEKSPEIIRYDEDGVALTMERKHFLGDGIGQFALNCFTGLAAQLTYFYTNQIGLAAAVVSSMLFVSGLIDAMTDLFAGRLIDRTNSKYGKAKPWMLWLSIPTVIVLVGMFSVPSGMSSSFQRSFLLVSHVLAIGVVYTILNIAYNTLLVTRTRSSQERSSMGIYRAISGYISGMVIAIALIPLTNLLGGDQRAWMIVTGTLAILAGFSLVITFLTANENNSQATITENRDEDIPVKETLKMLFKNKNWLIVSLVMLVMQIQWNLATATGVFYAEYVLGDPNLVGIMGAAGLIPTVLGFIFAPIMIKKWGAYTTIRTSLIVSIISISIRVFMPASFIAAIVFGSLGSFSQIPYMMANPVLSSNTFEWNEWKYGYRLIGIGQSAGSFAAKMGTVLGTSLVGWVLAIGGFDATLGLNQGTGAIYAIYAISIYIPLIINIMSFILFSKYDLHLYYGDIIKDLKEKENK